MSVTGILKGIQKDIGRKKTEILQLTGSIEKTVDGEFEICRLNLDDNIKFVTNLLKDVARFDQQIEEIIVDPIKSVAEDISQFLGNHPEAQQNTKGDLLDVAAWSNNSVTSYLKKQQQFATYAKVTLERLQIIKKKVEKRDRVLLDYDNHKAKLQSAQEQNKQDTIQREETRCKELNQQYDRINSELKQQITSEVDFLDQYFTKELKLLHSRQREVYFAMAESFKTIMDAETLIQIGSGSFVVSNESQYEALASPKPLPEQANNNTQQTEQPKAPSSPSLLGKIKTGTTNRISSMIEPKKPAQPGTSSASSPAATPAPTTAPPTTTAASPAVAPVTPTPTPPPKPAKPSQTGSIDQPPKRAPPTPGPKPSATTTASPTTTAASPDVVATAPEPAPQPQEHAPPSQQSVPERTGELDISEYHYDYTGGSNASPSLIPNDKRKTVVNPRMSTMFDTFSTTNAFGNPKDFSGMFGSDNPT